MKALKATILKFSITTMVLSPIAALAAQKGGVGDGGGNGVGSTAQDVINTLEGTATLLSLFVRGAAGNPLSPLNPTLVKDKRAQKVLETWLKLEDGREALLRDAELSKYQPQAAACASEPGTDHDASTPYKRGATVCFSTARLVRFPKWTLKAELVALAAHEHAHHFGFDEESAVAIQRHVLDAYGLLEVQRSAAQFIRSNLDNYRGRSAAPGSPAAVAFAKRICRNYNVLIGQAIAYGVTVFERELATKPICEPESFDPSAVEKRLRELIKLSIDALK